MPTVFPESKQPNCENCRHRHFVENIENDSLPMGREARPPLGKIYQCEHADEVKADHYNKLVTQFFPCEDHEAG